MKANIPSRLAMLNTPRAGERFFMLWPVIRTRYVPAIQTIGGHCIPCYVIVGNDKPGDRFKMRVFKPDQVWRIVKQSEKRWICGFMVALERMQDVWERAGGMYGSEEAQKALGELLTVNPHVAERLIKTKLGKKRFAGMESHIKELLVLLYWGNLWRIRKPRKPSRAGLPWTVGGWDESFSALSLNEYIKRVFPKWQEWGWEYFTPRRVRSIVDNLCLERGLSDGRLR